MLPFLAERLERAQSLAFQPPFAEWQARVRHMWQGFLPQGKTVQQGDRLRHVTGDVGEFILMRPEGDGPHPAIMLLHDHGGRFDIGWRKMVAGQGSDAALYEGRHLADWLVARGYAVLCHDALGWGSRVAGGYDEQQALAAQAMQAGWSLAGITVAEDLGCAEWLAAQPGIDPTRIGAMGFSFGGFRAWQLAALCPRIRATVSIGWMGFRADLLRDGTLVKGQSAFHTLHPFLDADYPDLAALACDRPLYLRVGDADRHFPRPEAAFDRIRQIASVDAATFAGAHVFPLVEQEMAALFLDRHLR